MCYLELFVTEKTSTCDVFSGYSDLLLPLLGNGPCIHLYFKFPSHIINWQRMSTHFCTVDVNSRVGKLAH